MTPEESAELIRISINLASWASAFRFRAASTAEIGSGITDSWSQRVADELQGGSDSLNKLTRPQSLAPQSGQDTSLTFGLPIWWPIAGKLPDKSLITHPGGWSNDHLARGELAALDLAVWTGTPLCSKIPGVITQAGYLGKAGNAVTTEYDYNGHHYLSRECHLYQVDVSVGDMAMAGHLIGQSGNTGHSDGPHLHTFLEVDQVRVRLEDVWFPRGE